MNPEDFPILLTTLAPLIQSVIRRVSRWQTPANWSRADWADEERAVVNLAVCQTVRDHSQVADNSLEQTVYFHALGRALTRYRQESLYSGRFLPLMPTEDTADEEENVPTIAPRWCPVDESVCTPEWLTAAIEGLPKPDSQLIEKLFWQERTQADIARELNISQRAVSQRRQRVLKNLRVAFKKQRRISPISSQTEASTGL